MKEHPILFSTKMVKAIIDGRKTMTRRVVKPQPESKFCNGEWYPDRYNHTEDWCFWGKRDTDVFNKCGLPLFQCPYGQVGDRLWVRETYRIADSNDCACYEPCSCSKNFGNPIYYADDIDDESKWKPSIFMPRKFSRITLEITDTRVERLQDIPLLDIVKEGCDNATDNYTKSMWFMRLWDSINAKRGYSWEANLWVWVVEFKRI